MSGAHETGSHDLHPTLFVVGVIGLVLLAAVVLIGLLAFSGKPIPDVLQNVAVGSLTGLVGLLVKPPTGA